MASSIGKRLTRLEKGNKFAVEFLLYLITAVASEKIGHTSAKSKFVRDVVMDIPSELARRMINGSFKADFSAPDFSELLHSIQPAEFDNLFKFMEPPEEGNYNFTPPATNTTGLSKWLQKRSQIAKKMRKNLAVKMNKR